MSLLFCLLVLCFSEINLLLESSHCDGPNHLVIRGFHCLCQWVAICQVLPKTGVWACSDDRYNDKLGGRSCKNQERKDQLIAIVSKCALYVFNVIPTRLPYPCNFITVLIVNQEQEQTTLLFWSNVCRESVFSLWPTLHCYLCVWVSILGVLNFFLLAENKSRLLYTCCGLLFVWFHCLSSSTVHHGIITLAHIHIQFWKICRCFFSVLNWLWHWKDVLCLFLLYFKNIPNPHKLLAGSMMSCQHLP